jgi:hypothetical protein
MTDCTPCVRVRSSKRLSSQPRCVRVHLVLEARPRNIAETSRLLLYRARARHSESLLRGVRVMTTNQWICTARTSLLLAAFVALGAGCKSTSSEDANGGSTSASSTSSSYARCSELKGQDRAECRRRAAAGSTTAPAESTGSQATAEPATPTEPTGETATPTEPPR